MYENSTGPDLPAGPTIDQVADILAAATTIGRACDEFRKAGWRSTIAGNRITVNDELFARYIDGCSLGDARSNPDSARWLVYAVGDCPEVRMVAASGDFLPSQDRPA
jgi:hypothetical protein